ncbi:MAG: zinc-ribbon domain-containing protein [Deltaproteobacteria bacterium]|jgi:methyl-accepting chemotaxis protein|nr:zinc-ribbon domain-containing protein [Deltaproteobacteria bacterium]
MMDIICDECGKKYRVDETRMKGQKAKVKCKACANIMVVTKPAPEIPDEPPPVPDMPEEQQPPEPQIPEQPAERPASLRPEAEDLHREAPPFYGGQKVRFGLFGKIITVMLIVSLLPFAIFWGITLRETNERIRADTEALMAQTASGLENQINGWINNNVAILRTAAKLPEIQSMDGILQKPILETIQKQYPWMYLVFTVGPDGFNVARSDDVPLKDYSDRQYYKDIIRGKGLSWQTLIGKTSKKPALVLSVPITAADQTVGVMAAAMTIDDISKSIATWKKGSTGYAFLVDDKGYVVAHPNRQFVATRKNLNSHPLIANYRKKGWTTITTQFSTANDKPALGHVRSNNYGWALAMQQEDTEVFAALNRMQKFALTLLGCTVLLVSVIAWFSARAIVTPVMKLTDAAERMSLGELNVKIDIKSRDEIGLLAQAIGRMQTSLRLAMNRLRRKR